ncbi:hypothetical protein DFH07DRAFT_843561 [Mycena maculata]|uniref:MYND-type domain-containing protein n=1 Tax=Mycena maculata TaxID=230809 RepID=A0AAD7MWU3_9AGAR|nr:hypothetical protein DFH07DRAFT_843561 [Mycena maculata]
MHESLSLERIQEFPPALRDVAISAARGLPGDYFLLHRSIDEAESPEELYPLCLPIVFAALDPVRIPREDGPSAATAMAAISLRFLWTRGFPVNAGVDIWPRLWSWLLFMHQLPNHYCVALIGADISTSVLMFVGRLVCDPASLSLISRTVGMRAILVRAWRLKFEHLEEDASGMPHLEAILRNLDLTKDPAHLQECVEGAGGSLHNFFGLITEFINFLVPTTRSTLSTRAHYFLDAIFYPINGTPDNEEVRRARHGAGLATSLIRMMCALARYSGPRIPTHMGPSATEDLLGAAVLKLAVMLKDPPQEKAFQEAVFAGILRAIVLYGIRGAEVEITTELLKYTLPLFTVHYSVISEMESAFQDVTDVAADPLFAKSAIFEAWVAFRDLAGTRIALAKFWASEIYISRNACDNMECGIIGPKTEFTRCGHCHTVFYCSRKCQRADWKYVHRTNCGSLRSFGLRYRDTLSSQNISFMKALVQSDYQKNKEEILRKQVTFIRNNPDLPIVTVFDYGAGRVRITVETIYPASSLMTNYIGINCVEYVPRAVRSGGRMELHLAAVPTGTSRRARMFPMRSNNSSLHDGVRRLAAEGTEDLARRVQILIAKTRDGLVQIH